MIRKFLIGKQATSTIVLLFVSYIVVGTLFFIKIHRLPPQVPLVYSQLEGESQITDTIFLFILPALATIIVFVNSVIKNTLFSENEFVEEIIMYANILVIVISTIIFTRIVFLVT